MKDEEETYCGIEPFTTGKRDPWYKRSLACKRHDPPMQALIDGRVEATEPALKTFGRFTKDIIGGMAEGAYMLMSGPVYWLIGGVLGIGRQGYLERKHKAEKPWVMKGDKELKGEE